MTTPQNTRPPHYDLCVVGAGISGLNALYSATEYLGSQQRVLLLDRNPAPGGMWNDVYDYVRLHQPHPMFTAGNIPWRLRRPPAYRATKREVLDHLADCLAVLADRVRLDARFETFFESAEESGNGVDVRYRGADGAEHVVRADRLLKAVASDVEALEPLRLTSGSVHSVTPNECDVREIGSDPAPLWIVGSGKTAIDTAYAALTARPDRAVGMFAGSGTWFADRDTMYPSGLRRWRSPRPNAVFTRISRQYDGTNEQAVADEALTSIGLRITPGTGNFVAGLVSRAERDTVVRGLHPVIDGHLTDVVDGPGGPVAVLRDGGTVPITPGARVINCTGHFRVDHTVDEPYASATGRVAAITRSSWIMHFGSFAGYFLPHLMYRDLLGTVPLYAADLGAIMRRDPHVMIYLMSTLALHNLGLLSEVVPPGVFLRCGLDFDNWVPLPRRLVGTAQFLATRRRDRVHFRRTLDTIADRYGIRCAPLTHVAAA
ncbi:NAD(P)-binding protein [Tsukamurella sp. NPDC003166]|uniref:NAD(P)-binding protein n=1 Tax=Tsukamurella sp. NPDC003166 TaxID=3154444 RepID=UPI0033A1AF42